MKPWVLILCSVFNVAGQICYAQDRDQSSPREISLLQFNSEDGLDAFEIMAIAEDDDGFVWLGTDRGLQRFDGSQLKVFLPDPRDSNSISFERINHLISGMNKKIWIGSEHSGLCVLDLKTMKFKSYQSIPNDPTTLANNAICALHEDESGLWVLTANAVLNFLPHNSNRFVRYRLPRSTPAQETFFISDFNQIITDRNNRNKLWITTVVGLFEFDKNTSTFRDYFPDRSRTAIFYENYFHDIWQDPKGVIWCSYYYGLVSFDPSTTLWQSYPLLNFLKWKDGFDGTRILPESDSVINLLTQPFAWVRFNIQTKKFVLCEPHITNKRHWEDLYLLGATKMKNGSIWISGWRSINKVELTVPPFYTSYFTDQTNKPLFRPNMPVAAVEIGKSKQVLIGTAGGEGVILLEDYKTGRGKPIHSWNLPENLNEGTVEDIEPKQNNQWWLGIRGGLFTYTMGDSLFRPYINEQTGEMLFKENIRSLFVDTDNSLWIGTFGYGLYHLNPKTNELKHYRYRPGDSSSIRSNLLICDIIRGPDKKIWVAYQDCISILDEKNDKFKHLDYRIPGMPRNTELYATDIDTDESGNVWAATGQGLIRIRIDKNGSPIVKTYTIQDGIKSSILNELVIDHNNNLWITTHNSLSFFNTATESFINFGQSNGISHVSRSSMIEKLSNGIILYSMWGSVLWFHPDSIMHYQGLPQPYLLSIQINNNEYHDVSPDQTDQLILSHQKTNLSFQLGGLGLSGDFRHYYAYRLLHYDDNWTYSGQRHYVNYTNLPPGKYIFQFKVANSLGQWNDNIKELAIRINPAFWQTWWFKILSILFIALVATILVRRRIKSIRHEAEMKQRMAETEMMALRAQMNPHFIFNCLNAIDNLIQTHQPDKATTYLARFAKLIRSVLDSSKNNVVSFQKDFESLHLYLQMEQFRCSNKFNYELNASETLLLGDYPVPPLVIQPFIENAIHHGLLNKLDSDRDLKINITTDQHYINYMIIDNGVGRKRAAELKMINKPEHESYGIRISTDRIHLYNKNGITDDVIITDLEEDGKAAGTKIEVKIKIHEAH